MKKNYILFIISVIAIFALQSMYIKSSYDRFISNELNNIDKKLYRAISLELHSRGLSDKDVEYKVSITDFKDLSKKTRDSLDLLSKKPQKKYDVKKLLEKNIIRSADELFSQINQDNYFNNGITINIHTLDSIFKHTLNSDYKYRITNLDSIGNIIDCSNKEDRIYSYKIDTKPIGLEGFQNIKTEIDIPISSYLKISIITTIASLIIVLITFFALFYLIFVLKKKNHDLNAREQSINGVLHDIKSPISNAALMLETLSLISDNKDFKDIIAANNTNIRLLSSKIESLLAVSRSKNRKFVANKTIVNSVDIKKRVDDVVLVLSQRYLYKNPTINIENNLKYDVNIDLLYFESILLNLLENSLKYSDNKVIIDIAIYNENNSIFALEIKDNGLGIEKKDYKNIFDQYYRVDDNYCKGTGIGLNYSRILARVHGGDLILKSSTLGLGSIFKATFNIDKDGN